MGKGEQTREAILDQALDLSSEVGLEGLTVGVLAQRVGMSKSGLYAHFKSKEALQCQVLDAASARFVDVVLTPALKQPRGLPRLEMLFECWLQWETSVLSGGCPFITAAAEFDDREGPVRDHLIAQLNDMLGAVARAASIAVEEGHFRAGADTEQFAYDWWAMMLAFQQYARLLDRTDAEARLRRAFADLVARSQR